MANTPQNWEHNNGYYLNADGKSMEYRHTEDDHLLAIVEAVVNEDEQTLQYYTVIFDTRESRPWKTVEPHEIHQRKDEAKGYLYDLMEKHA